MPILSTRAQLAIAIALVILMAMTRGQHFASVENLPSASWSIFFLAGVYLRSRWVFTLLFIEASLLDFGSLASGTIGDWCVSPAYWILVPAYACLWLAGRLFAGHAPGETLRSLGMLVVTLVVAAFITHLLSSGGFYFLSGRYPEPTLRGFLPRIAHYYPRYLSNLGLYVGIATVLHIGIASWFRLQRNHEARP